MSHTFDQRQAANARAICPESSIYSLSPPDQLLLVGLGEVTRYAAQFAEAVDFEVTVCDPRATYLTLYPMHSVPVLHANPDRLIADRFHDEHSAIITLSHDPASMTSP